MAKGYSRRHGIDYEETFSPVVRLESVRLILSVVAREDFDIVHFDIKTAFLYGSLDEEISMEEPEGFTSGKGKACKLQRSVYGLKQASRVWNTCFTSFLKDFNLSPLKTDSCVLVRSKGDDMLIVAIYVDDGLVCSNNPKLLDETVAYLQRKFEITIMEAKCFVGLQITRGRGKMLLSVSQFNYVGRLIRQFELQDAMVKRVPMDPSVKLMKDGVVDGPKSKTVHVPYRELIGSLMLRLLSVSLETQNQ